jgi:N6-adenosine-specific RNA methylase IME4
MQAEGKTNKAGESSALALPSVERARAMLLRCTSLGEIGRIRAIAQAVATLERGKEIGCDAGEICTLADRRRAELEAEERTGRRTGPVVGNSGVTNSTLPKTQLMAESRRAPLLALPEKDMQTYFDTCRAARVPATTMGAAALGKLPADLRKEALVLLKNADGHVPKAIGEVKLAAKRSLAEEIRSNPKVTPDGRYQVIAVDPPWKYDNRAEDTTHRGRNDYPEMTVDEICAAPVANLAQTNCVLWLWTTNAFMREAFQCIDAWGFKDKTILTWDKENMGLGDWLRNVTEHCILAVRGKPIVSLTNQTTLIREKRRQHSRKPEAFYALVEALCPGSKLEMFSRTERAGWTAWGAETEKFRAVQ